MIRPERFDVRTLRERGKPGWYLIIWNGRFRGVVKVRRSKAGVATLSVQIPFNKAFPNPMLIGPFDGRDIVEGLAILTERRFSYGSVLQGLGKFTGRHRRWERKSKEIDQQLTDAASNSIRQVLIYGPLSLTVLLERLRENGSRITDYWIGIYLERLESAKRVVRVKANSGPIYSLPDTYN